MVLVLGTTAFMDFEMPEEMPFGGSQTLQVHRLMGGKRVIDAMGPNEAAITWAGRFRGPFAQVRARQLDTMRRAGRVHILTWNLFCYRVVIREFKGTFLRLHEIPYSITVEVLEDLVAGAAEALLDSIEDAVTGYIGDALGLAEGSPVLTGIVTAAGAAVTSVATSGSLDFSTVGNVAMSGVASGVGAAAGAAGGFSGLAQAALPSGALTDALTGPASQMGAKVLNVVDAGNLAYRAEGVNVDLKNASLNVNKVGQ